MVGSNELPSSLGLEEMAGDSAAGGGWESKNAGQKLRNALFGVWTCSACQAPLLATESRKPGPLSRPHFFHSVFKLSEP